MMLVEAEKVVVALKLEEAAALIDKKIACQ